MSFNVLLHNGGALLVKDGGQDAVRQVDHRDGGVLFGYTLGAFEPNESRADDQHLRPGEERRLKRVRVVEGEEGEFPFDQLHPLCWRDERAVAGGHEQPVVGDRPAGGLHGSGFWADGGRFPAEQGVHAVLLVEVVRAVFYPLLIPLPAEQVGVPADGWRHR